MHDQQVSCLTQISVPHSKKLLENPSQDVRTYGHKQIRKEPYQVQLNSSDFLE